MVDFDWRTACFDAEQRYINEKRENIKLKEVAMMMADLISYGGDFQKIGANGKYIQMTPEEIFKDFYNNLESKEVFD